MLRRTMSIEDTLHQDVNRVRSLFLGKNIEIDYTSAVNILAKLGAKRLLSGQIKEDEWAIVFLYLKNQQLQDEALMDQAQDWFIRNFPKYVENFIKAQTTAQTTKK